MPNTPTTTVNDQMSTYFGAGSINDSLHSYILNSGAATGTASPESATTGAVGDMFRDSTTPNLYLKTSGAGNTGWSIFGRVPVASLTTFTQTYSTTTTTVPTQTATAVATTASTDTTPFGYSTQAQADAIVTALNATIADVLANRKLINKIIDILQLANLSL